MTEDDKHEAGVVITQLWAATRALDKATRRLEAAEKANRQAQELIGRCGAELATATRAVSEALAALRDATARVKQ